MTNIPLALRLLECGLPVPNHWIKGTVATIHTTAQLQVDCGHRWRNPYTNEEGGILWTFVTTETGPRLLPDTSDSLLIGYVLAECRKHWPKLGTWYAPSRFEWMAGFGAQRWHAETELEALVAAWESALAAGKAAK